MWDEDPICTPERIQEIVDTGSSFESVLLTRAELRALNADAQRIVWIPQHYNGDPWFRYNDAKVPDTDEFSAIHGLGRRLEGEIRVMSNRWPSLTTYRANDVTAQEYPDEDCGIETHQDYSADRLLIIVVTIRGRGSFDIMTARHGGRVKQRYETVPGSVIWMAAPDLVVTDNDIRPPHRLTRPTGGRISITYRYTVGEAHFKNEQRP